MKFDSIVVILTCGLLGFGIVWNYLSNRAPRTTSAPSISLSKPELISFNPVSDTGWLVPWAFDQAHLQAVGIGFRHVSVLIRRNNITTCHLDPTWHEICRMLTDSAESPIDSIRAVGFNDRFCVDVIK